ncbi:unnamed protein product [Merluccius merluccius]
MLLVLVVLMLILLLLLKKMLKKMLLVLMLLLLLRMLLVLMLRYPPGRVHGEPCTITTTTYSISTTISIITGTVAFLRNGKRIDLHNLSSLASRSKR